MSGKNKEIGVGPGSYTMGVKFQVRTNIDENSIKLIYEKDNKKISSYIFFAAIICLILTIYQNYTYGPAGPYKIFLYVDIILWGIGVISPKILPEIRMILAKRNEETGYQKMTVFEEECLIYSEKFQNTRTMMFENVKKFESINGFYVIRWPDMTFAFREKDFLVGDGTSFMSFMARIK